MNINWSKKPDWADVWIEDLEQPTYSGWHKEEADRFVDEQGLHYKKFQMKANETVYYPPKETKTEWSGERLPPVGTVCEWVDSDGCKVLGYITAIGERSLLFMTMYEELQIPRILWNFKPAKSDKEKWVEKAMKCCDPNYEQIYDALISGELTMPKELRMNQSNFAHSRIDIIGSNGNDGVHYEHPFDVPELDQEWYKKDSSNYSTLEEEEYFKHIEANQDQSVGTKYDSDKPRMNLIPPSAELLLAQVLTYGAKKYAPDNWRKVPEAETRYIAAAMRHINAYRSGEWLDEESNLPHLAHAMCCLAFILELNND